MGDSRSTTPKPERDSWSTPKFIFDWLNSEYYFDIDLAAAWDNTHCHRYFSLHDNSLNALWSTYGKTGFLNPPYSNIKVWIEKAIKEQTKGFTTVMLIPTPNGEYYYKELFKFASEVIMINGRISFIDSTGESKGGNPRGSCVVVFGSMAGNPRLLNIDRDEIKARFSA